MQNITSVTIKEEESFIHTQSFINYCHGLQHSTSSKVKALNNTDLPYTWRILCKSKCNAQYPLCIKLTLYINIYIKTAIKIFIRKEKRKQYKYYVIKNENIYLQNKTHPFPWWV